jgi:hypothetical protein
MKQNEQEPLPEIELRELAWVFEAAGEHFLENYKKYRDERMTLHQMIAHGLYELNTELPRLGPVTKTVEERLTELQQYMHRAERLLRFCRISKDKISEQTAKEFATLFKVRKQQ